MIARTANPVIAPGTIASSHTHVPQNICPTTGAMSRWCPEPNGHSVASAGLADNADMSVIKNAPTGAAAVAMAAPRLPHATEASSAAAKYIANNNGIMTG